MSVMATFDREIEDKLREDAFREDLKLARAVIEGNLTGHELARLSAEVMLGEPGCERDPWSCD